MTTEADAPVGDALRRWFAVGCLGWVFMGKDDEWRERRCTGMLEAQTQPDRGVRRRMLALLGRVGE